MCPRLKGEIVLDGTFRIGVSKVRICLPFSKEDEWRGRSRVDDGPWDFRRHPSVLPPLTCLSCFGWPGRRGTSSPTPWGPGQVEQKADSFVLRDPSRPTSRGLPETTRGAFRSPLSVRAVGKGFSLLWQTLPKNYFFFFFSRCSVLTFVTVSSVSFPSLWL